MDASHWIALGALIITVASFLKSNASMTLSRQTATRDHDFKVKLLRADVLSVLSESRRILHLTYTEIGALKADFDAEPQTVQTLLQNYTKLFSENFPKIITARDSVETEWLSIHNWTGHASYTDLLRRKAEYEDSLNDYKYINDNATLLVSQFREKMESAINYDP